jgi:hypothetical protein
LGISKKLFVISNCTLENYRSNTVYFNLFLNKI